MKRRSFVKASLMTGSISAVATVAALAADSADAKKTSQEIYELRVYQLKDARQQKVVEDYYQLAAIPALNRLGIRSVGVFKEQLPDSAD